KQGRLPLSLLEPIDDDGARKRDLGMRELKNFFANDLRREKTLGTVGQEVVGIETLPFRQALEDRALETIDALARGGGYRHNLREVGRGPVAIDQGQQPGFSHEVDLVEDQEH